MLLLDTDVLSALRRRERNPAVTRWLEAQRTADLYLSVVTVGEIERGIAQQRRRNPPFAEDLATSLAEPSAGVVRRTGAADRHPHRATLGAALRRSRSRQRGSADCRDCAGARPDRRNAQHETLRADGRPGAQPVPGCAVTAPRCEGTAPVPRFDADSACSLPSETVVLGGELAVPCNPQSAQRG